VALLLLACGARTAIADSCSISITNIQFGSYTGATIRYTGTASVNCTNGTAYYVSLDAGIASGATATNRSMTGSTTLALLEYGLFSDAGYSSNWGNTSGSGWVAGTGNGLTQNLTVYAQIPAGQYAPVDTYSDLITATISPGTGSTFSNATSQSTISANVAKACSISANPLAFGVYAGSRVTSTTTLTVTCTNTTTYNVGLDAGQSSGATVTNRSMTGPSSALLNYALFSNAGLSINWGNTVGTDTVAGTGSGATQSLTVYGQIPAGQYVAQGSYADTITVTITY
jgi:spore coat protein U-like protein